MENTYEELYQYLDSQETAITKQDLTNKYLKIALNQFFNPNAKYQQDFIFMLSKDNKPIAKKQAIKHLSKLSKALFNLYDADCEIIPNIWPLNKNKSFNLLAIGFLKNDKGPYVSIRHLVPNLIHKLTKTRPDAPIDSKFEITYITTKSYMWLTNTNRIIYTNATFSADLPISESLDGTDTYDTILYNFKPLLTSRDFYRLQNMDSISNILRPRISLTYTKLLNSKKTNHKDLLFDTMPRIKTLSKTININKLTPFELSVFKYLKYKLTENEFKRILNDYKTNKQEYIDLINNICNHDSDVRDNLMYYTRQICTQWKGIYWLYLIRHFNINTETEENEYTNFIRIFDLYTALKHHKFEVKTKSLSRFNYRVGILVHKDEIHKTCQKWNIKQDQILPKKEKWNKIYQAFNDFNKKHKHQITNVDTVTKLLNEGDMQNNCVATYTEKVYKNHSTIFHYDQDEDQYTFEVAMHRNHTFYLKQIYRQDDLPANPDVTQKLTKLIENAK